MCEICKRYEDRIATAAAEGDQRKCALMRKMYQVHKNDARYHPARAWLRGKHEIIR